MYRANINFNGLAWIQAVGGNLINILLWLNEEHVNIDDHLLIELREKISIPTIN